MLTQSQIRSAWSPACKGPWALVSLYGAAKVSVRPAVVEATKALSKVLTTYKYATRANDTGAYNCRKVTGGSTYSLHAYGIAIDINWQSNPYGSRLITNMRNYGDGKMPEAIQAIRTNNGKQVWRWGGNFSGNKDAMHYEVVCSPADLRTGINWRTVKGYVAPKPPAPTPATKYPLVKLGSNNCYVALLQQRLNFVSGTRLKVDGDFGPATDTAVRNFQRFCKLTADGQCGTKTWNALNYLYALKGGK